MRSGPVQYTTMVATAATFLILQVVDMLHAVELLQPWRSDNDYRDPEYDTAAAAYHIQKTSSTDFHTKIFQK